MQPFDWQRLLLGEDTSWLFLLEIVFRTLVMYGMLMLFFKMTGKTGIKQLSLFDFILIIGLGSAAGDPMFYEEVPLVYALVVFASILGIYLLINKLTQKSHKMDEILEGKPVCILADGVIDWKLMEKQGLTSMQFYSELRQAQVSQLGQLRYVYLEASGQPSLFFVEDEKVIPGLPLLLHLINDKVEVFNQEQLYSCTKCGTTQRVSHSSTDAICSNCHSKSFVVAIDERRVA